jgi:hypothetical protein
MAVTAATGLLLGIMMRPPRAPRPGTAASAGRAAGGLAIVPGASSVDVSFESGLAGGLLVEAETRGSGPPRTFRAPAEKVSAAGRRAVVGGLPPSARVRVRVLAPDGAELGWRDVNTRSIEDVARDLVAGLAALSAFENGWDMMHDIERGLRARDGSDRSRHVEQARRRWETRMREILVRRRLESLVADFAPLAERAMGSPDLPAELRRALYDLTLDLAELEETASRCRVPLPALAARLVTRSYGVVEAPSIAAPTAVLISLDDDPHGPREALKPAGPVTTIPMGGQHLIIYSDLRKARDMVVGTFGEGVLNPPGPLALPDPARVRSIEISALLEHCSPDNGIRVMIGSRPSVERSDFRTVALLRSRELGRHVVTHAVPADILSQRPLYVRLEFAYSPVALIFGDVVEQHCWLKWLAFACQAASEASRSSLRDETHDPRAQRSSSVGARPGPR